MNLLSVEDLGTAGVDELMRLTDTFVEVSARPIPKVPALRGRTVAMMFFEESTRTRLSFETAAKRLSADTLGFAAKTSSLGKGESLKDTARTVEALGVDAMVVRHPSSGAPTQIASWVGCCVVNGGDGSHEHPTQALLDLYTMRQHLGDLEGARIAIVGDIAHSRVARSLVQVVRLQGGESVLVGPPTLMPPGVDSWGVSVSDELDPVLSKVDVVYLLRMQLERQTGPVLPTLREYTAGYGLTRRRVDQLGEDCIVMHPGPMNRGVEIASDVADLPRSVVVDQVRNGVAVRMAVLFKLLGSGEGLDASR